MHMRTGHRSLALILILAACPATIGCQRGPVMVQVRGKVLNEDGSVITRGIREIRFEPMDDTTAVMRKTAIGQIQDDGTFELFTRRPGDGVLLGKYAVTISVIKAPRDPVLLIDEKYTTSATTPFHETIERDVDGLEYKVKMKNAAIN